MPRRRNRNNPKNVDRLVSDFLGLPRQVQAVIVVIALIVGGVLLFNYFRHQRQQERQTPPQPQAVPVPRAPTANVPPPPPMPPSQPSPARTTPPAELSGVSTGDVNHLLGNPSGATADPENRSNFLMVKPFYTLSYNATKGIPNWVSWRLTRADLGPARRKQLFDPDTTLPAGFYRVTHRDYSGSGFDRGHMCPHSDRAATQEMSFATFVMTNIIPQAPNVNQKTWADLEDYCRTLVTDRQSPARLYVVSGPVGQGGRGTAGETQTIAGGKVVVPAECWKVIVVVPADSGGPDDLQNVTPATRVIAVIMPNDNDAIQQGWGRYRTSAAAVEQRTGYHFFDRLPPQVADALRRKVDDGPVR